MTSLLAWIHPIFNGVNYSKRVNHYFLDPSFAHLQIYCWNVYHFLRGWGTSPISKVLSFVERLWSARNDASFYFKYVGTLQLSGCLTSNNTFQVNSHLMVPSVLSPSLLFITIKTFKWVNVFGNQSENIGKIKYNMPVLPRTNLIAQMLFEFSLIV